MVTRVTNSMLKSTLLSNLYTNLNNYDRLQNQLASGRTYAHISDNPSSLIYGQAARNKLARLGHFQDAVSSAQSWMMQTEAAVMEAQKTMASVYEEIVNAGGAKTLYDRQNIGMMISQLRSHYLDTLNSSYGDRFIFGGYNTPGDYINDPNLTDGTIKPFTLETDAAGNTTLFFNGFNTSQFDGLPAVFLEGDNSYGEWDAAANNAGFFGATAVDDWLTSLGFTLQHDRPGDMNAVPPIPPQPPLQGVDVISEMHRLMKEVLTFDVGPGMEMPVTFNGFDILFFSTYDENGNAIMRNTYSLLDDVHYQVTAEVTVEDPPGSGNFRGTGEPLFTVDQLSLPLLKYVKEAQNSLLVKTAEVGGRDRRLELMAARYDADEINYESMRSDAEDADIAEVIMYMKMAETVYQAALSAGARIIQPTLMDFLR